MPISGSGFASKARQLVSTCTSGVLATLLSNDKDQPFGSMVNYATDAKRRPLFLLSTLAVHTRNLKAHDRASLTVWAERAEMQLLESARLTLIGRVTTVTPAERGAVRGTYLERHPSARDYVDFGDFSFYRMDVESVYYIGGFGEMGWISAPDYRGE